MKKLLNGISEFRKSILPTCREKFRMLAMGQNPDVLFITCSDSRVAPNWFASTDPGDLFVLRNLGNLVPPATDDVEHIPLDGSALAAAEFAVRQLKVSDVVVCGHSECGAMNALLSATPLEDSPHLKSWLAYGEASLANFQRGLSIDSSLSPVNQLSQLNVLQQVEHLKSHNFIHQEIQAGRLQVHGWWFDIAHASVYSFDETLRRFRLIE